MIFLHDSLFVFNYWFTDGLFSQRIHTTRYWFDQTTSIISSAQRMHENIESLKCDCSPDLHLPPRIGDTTTTPKPVVAMKRYQCHHWGGCSCKASSIWKPHSLCHRPLLCYSVIIAFPPFPPPYNTVITWRDRPIREYAIYARPPTTYIQAGDFMSYTEAISWQTVGWKKGGFISFDLSSCPPPKSLKRTARCWIGGWSQHTARP